MLARACQRKKSLGTIIDTRPKKVNSHKILGLAASTRPKTSQLSLQNSAEVSRALSAQAVVVLWVAMARCWACLPTWMHAVFRQLLSPGLSPDVVPLEVAVTLDVGCWSTEAERSVPYVMGSVL